jgi:hypothetical protein
MMDRQAFHRSFYGTEGVAFDKDRRDDDGPQTAAAIVVLPVFSDCLKQQPADYGIDCGVRSGRWTQSYRSKLRTSGSVKPVHMAVYADEDFLDQVLSLLPIADGPEDEVQQARLVPRY